MTIKNFEKPNETERCLVCRKVLRRKKSITKLCSSCQGMHLGRALKRGLVILKANGQKG